MEVLASSPGDGVRAGVQSTPLKLLLDSWRLAEGELGMTANSSVIGYINTGDRFHLARGDLGGFNTGVRN